MLRVWRARAACAHAAPGAAPASRPARCPRALALATCARARAFAHASAAEQFRELLESAREAPPEGADAPPLSPFQLRYARRDPVRVCATVAGRPLSLEVGRVGPLADAVVHARFGDTALIVSAVSKWAPTPGAGGGGGLPLQVDYRERAFGAGAIPGGMSRREPGTSDRETLAARAVDRALRPLFPPGYAFDTQLIVTVLAFDADADPVMLAIVAASAALHVSDIPWAGPAAAVRVGWLAAPGGRAAAHADATASAGAGLPGGPILAPSAPDAARSSLDLLYAGGGGGGGRPPRTLMLEVGGAQVPESALVAALRFADAAIAPLLALQHELRAAVGRPKRAVWTPRPAPATVAAVRALILDDARALYRTHGFRKAQRGNAQRLLALRVAEELAPSLPAGEQRLLGAAVDAVVKEALRGLVHEGADAAEAVDAADAAAGGGAAAGAAVDALTGLPAPAGEVVFADRGDGGGAGGDAPSALRLVPLRPAAAAAGCRPDGRSTTDIRTIAAAVDVLPPPVHGSAVFARGDTQVLCTATLGPADLALMARPASLTPATAAAGGQPRRHFFLHYDFPPYCTNEVGKVGGLNRRMVGHGALAERAIAPVMPPAVTARPGAEDAAASASAAGGAIAPAVARAAGATRGADDDDSDADDAVRGSGGGGAAPESATPAPSSAAAAPLFPYTVRCTSEVTGSDGSSSMATVCGAVLALMDAGVPLLAPVAGISVGVFAPRLPVPALPAVDAAVAAAVGGGDHIDVVATADASAPSSGTASAAPPVDETAEPCAAAPSDTTGRVAGREIDDAAPGDTSSQAAAATTATVAPSSDSSSDSDTDVDIAAGGADAAEREEVDGEVAVVADPPRAPPAAADSTGGGAAAALAAAAAAPSPPPPPPPPSPPPLRDGYDVPGGRYVLLTDIFGLEDHAGDMDFKVAGSATGVTAAQLDVKPAGLPLAVVEQALWRARDARLRVLAAMAAVLPQPRAALKPHAPSVAQLLLAPEGVSKLLAAGGGTLRRIAEATGASLHLDQAAPGAPTLSVYAPGAALATARRLLGAALEDHARLAGSPFAAVVPAGAPPLLVGDVLTATVSSSLEFGAVLSAGPHEVGWLHASELTERRRARVSDMLRPGDAVTAQVVDVDARGRAKFSVRSLLRRDGGPAYVEQPDDYERYVARAPAPVAAPVVAAASPPPAAERATPASESAATAAAAAVASARRAATVAAEATTAAAAGTTPAAASAKPRAARVAAATTGARNGGASAGGSSDERRGYAITPPAPPAAVAPAAAPDAPGVTTTDDDDDAGGAPLAASLLLSDDDAPAVDAATARGLRRLAREEGILAAAAAASAVATATAGGRQRGAAGAAAVDAPLPPAAAGGGRRHAAAVAPPRPSALRAPEAAPTVCAPTSAGVAVDPWAGDGGRDVGDVAAAGDDDPADATGRQAFAATTFWYLLPALKRVKQQRRAPGGVRP